MHSQIVGLNNTETLLDNKQKLAKINAERRKLQSEAKKIAKATNSIRGSTLEELALSFCSEMSDPIIFDNYVHNKYRGWFTNYVNRNGVVLSMRHSKVIENFNQAWYELNKTFAAYARDDPKSFVRQIIKQAGLKNLT